MKKRTLGIGITAAVIVVGGFATAGTMYYINKNNSVPSMTMNHQATSGPYIVNLMSGTSYQSGQPTSLRFTVNQNSKPFKNFADDNTKLMHLIVVRKDRTYFQHVHPDYDSASGTFTMNHFTFPTDGQYRVFANFAPVSAAKDSMGMVETEAPYVDVSVGDTSKVTSTPLGTDSLTSSAGGMVASLASAPGGDSPVTVTQPTYYAGVDGQVTVQLTKDNALVKDLQLYLGSLGHMVILGPDLEFIHAHPMNNDISSQTGYIPFMVTFPKSGQYKIYLQTQAGGAVSTFDFNVTVKDMAKSDSSHSMDNMPGMSQ